MRITSNMLVQQMVQATKGEGAQKTAVGAAITARIAEVLGGVLTLDTGNGNLITAKDLSGRSFQQGQTVIFEVLGQDEAGNLQIRPMTAGTEMELQSDNLGPLLKKMNLPDTASNRELLRVLSSYRIPLSHENVKAAQEINMQAKAIVQAVETQGSGILAGREEVSLKQLAVQLVEMAAVTSKGAAAESKPVSGVVAEGMETDSPAEEAPSKSQSLKNAAISLIDEVSGEARRTAVEKAALLLQELKSGSEPQKSSVAAIATSEDPAHEASKTRQGVKPATVPGTVETSGSLRSEGLKELLKELTFEKIGFVLKNQLPGDMETLDSLDKLIMGKKDLSIQLKELLVSLPANEGAAPLKEGIQNALKAVHIASDMDPFELQKQLKSLNQVLSSISSQAAETMLGQPRILDALTDVKNSLDFLSRLSESATYLHVPVNLGQGTKPMDLYVQRDKSGQKKVNPKDTRIFISLDTNHMDTVQCLVEVKDKALTIGFKLSDKEALSAISPYFDPLKEALAGMGYSDILIQAVIYQRPLNLMDITQEPPLGSQQIDMRV